MQEMEAAFVTALRLWVGLWGVIGVIVGLRRKGEFRWAHTERVIRPQWLGRVFFVVIGVFLIAAALLLKVAPKR